MTTSHRVIVLGSGKQIPLREYVRGWKACKDAPPKTEYKSSLCGWWPATREEILRQFDKGLHDRINRCIPVYGKGRKWQHNWQRATYQTAQAVNTPRLIVRWVPLEFRGRLVHRLYTGD